MLKQILLFAFLFLSHHTNAMDSANENQIYKEKLSEHELSLLDRISVQLWEVYNAQKQELEKTDSAVDIKTAWLLTMRVIISHLAEVAPKGSSSNHLRDLTPHEISKYLTEVSEFYLDHDERWFEALLKTRKQVEKYDYPKHWKDAQIDGETSFAKTYNFFRQNISQIIVPIFRVALKELPFRQLPFRQQINLSQSKANLTQAYERKLARLEVLKFEVLAPFLVPILPIIIVSEHHRSTFFHSYAFKIWPSVKQWKLAQNDRQSPLYKVWPDELISLVYAKSIEINLDDHE